MTVGEALAILDREIPTTERCDENLEQAHVVLEQPDQYTRRQFFDARRAVVKWGKLREASLALTTIRNHLSEEGS